MACQGLCNGSEVTAECQACVLDSQQGCGNQYEACANDFYASTRRHASTIKPIDRRQRR